jgi:hypothetical protein
MTSLIPPAISILGGKRYILPGYIEVDDDVTLEQVNEKWTRKTYKPGYIPTMFLEFIDINIGDIIPIMNGETETDSEVVKLYATCVHVMYKGVKYSLKKEYFIMDGDNFKSKERRLVKLKKQ